MAVKKASSENDGIEMEPLVLNNNNKQPSPGDDEEAAAGIMTDGSAITVIRYSYLPIIGNKKTTAIICRGITILCLAMALAGWITVLVSSVPTNKGHTTSSNRGLDFRAPGELRMDWAGLQPQSEIARELAAQRHNCSLGLRYHYFGEAGLGAELHAYTFSMCFAHKYGYRLYSRHFMYTDEETCHQAERDGLVARDSMSVLACYFQKLELQCPGDEATALEQQHADHVENYKMDYWKLWKDKYHDNVCDSFLSRPEYKSYDNLDMRSSAIEAMFTAGLSPVIVQEAKRQHALVFPDGAPPSRQLITVHVRWGDKGSEMALVPIEQYVASVKTIATAQGLQPNETHVYLATEDPAAVTAFQAAMSPEWHLYLDEFYVEMLPHRNNQTQEVAGVAKSGYGRTGLLALGSLLVSMEANHFVLTSASNWSRLMNEMRRSIVRAQCPGGWEEPHADARTIQSDCTSAIDLRKADFWMDLDSEGNGV